MGCLSFLQSSPAGLRRASPEPDHSRQTCEIDRQSSSPFQRRAVSKCDDSSAKYKSQTGLQLLREHKGKVDLIGSAVGVLQKEARLVGWQHLAYFMYRCFLERRQQLAGQMERRDNFLGLEQFDSIAESEEYSLLLQSIRAENKQIQEALPRLLDRTKKTVTLAFYNPEEKKMLADCLSPGSGEEYDSFLFYEGDALVQQQIKKGAERRVLIKVVDGLLVGLFGAGQVSMSEHREAVSQEDELYLQGQCQTLQRLGSATYYQE